MFFFSFPPGDLPNSLLLNVLESDSTSPRTLDFRRRKYERQINRNEFNPICVSTFIPWTK